MENMKYFVTYNSTYDENSTDEVVAGFVYEKDAKEYIEKQNPTLQHRFAIKKGKSKELSNFEKIKLITSQLQFFIDEGLVNGNDCGSVLEELYSTMEILNDSSADFKQEMDALAKVVGE